MKIGITTFVTDRGIRPSVLAEAVEDRGFDALFLPEHSHIPVSRATPFPFGDALPEPYFRVLDPFVGLSAAAEVTSTLKLGTGVALLVQRDVIHTAKEIASLDLLSSGRFLFGVGAGWNREEMRNHGVEPSTRGALLDEQLEAITTIWSVNEAEYHGKYVDFEPIFQWPKPMQRPHPPIYIGGTSAIAARRAASLSAGWMPTSVGDPQEVPAQLRLFAEYGGSGLPVTVTMVPRDPWFLDAYANAGAERVVLFLPERDETAALQRLDRLAAMAEEGDFLSG